MTKKYETYEYEITADDQTVVPLPALLDMELVRISLEEKPLKSTEWSWDNGTTNLTLSGVSTFQYQTLFILYSETVS